MTGRDRTPGGVDYPLLFTKIPTSYLVMSPEAPDYRILDANDAYLANVGRSRVEIVGRPVFEAFPATGDAFDEDGVPYIRRSFDRAVSTGRPDTMPLQKYDVPDQAGTGMVERYWSLISVPILGDDGAVVLLVQRAENITDFVGERTQGDDAADDEQWRRRVQEIEADLFARAQELASAVQAKDVVSRQLAGLAEVALQMGPAESVDDMVDVISRAALPVLQAAAAAIAVRAAAGDVLDVTLARRPGFAAVDGDRHELPVDGTLPISLAARGGMVLVRDEREAAAHPGLAEALSRTGTRSWAALPLQAGDRVLGSLSFGFARAQTFSAPEVELLRAFAAQCAQVLDRLQVRDAERRAAAAVQRIAETLQRSLLTAPPVSEHLRFAVGYQPAQEVAQVGGDWYDAFHVANGLTSLVIGDVAGHDQDSAAAMAQVRNILRGVAQTVAEPPAIVLAALDRAMDELGLDVLATVVLAQISPPEGPHGLRTMQWCNAGHPPPLVVRADGHVELLGGQPDLLVGLQPHSERADHLVRVARGDTVLLYTDGLVETRRGDLDVDLADLVRRAAAHRPADGPQALLDLVIERDTAPDDDVAVLAVQAL